MPQKTVEEIQKDNTLSPESDLRVWSASDCEVLVDHPRFTGFADGSSILDIYVEKLEEQIFLRKKISDLKQCLLRKLNIIKEIDEVFALFSDTMNIFEIKIFTNQKKYNNELSEKIFNLKIFTENKFPEHQIDIIYVPSNKNAEDNLLSNGYVRIFPE